MRTLVIETATAACSVALIEHGRVLANMHEVVGRGHAERLIPMIAALPDEGRAAHILVDVGPGSFTGVRVGLAAAHGLAIGWGATVSGYSSLALLGASALDEDRSLSRVAAILEGGHGEVFFQRFHGHPLTSEAPLRSLLPEAAIAELDGVPGFGSGVRFLEPFAPSEVLTAMWPNAAQTSLLPEALRSLPAKPLYGRAPDAKTLAERGLA